MNFNAGPTKRAQEVIFNCKTKNVSHLSLVFSDAHVSQSMYQKRLRIILHYKLKFHNHIKMVTNKIRILKSSVN